MNERIQELYKQAGFSIGLHNYYWGGADGKSLEKFAELLIKECISVPYDMWDKAELNADIAVKIEHRIKDHFGVEE